MPQTALLMIFDILNSYSLISVHSVLLFHLCWEILQEIQVRDRLCVLCEWCVCEALTLSWFQVSEREQRVVCVVRLVRQQLCAQCRLRRHVRRPGQPGFISQLPLTHAKPPAQGARVGTGAVPAGTGQNQGSALHFSISHINPKTYNINAISQ